MTRLLFAGPEKTLYRFPEPWELRRLDPRLSEAVAMDEFVCVAWQAKKRLWVLDLHFYEYGFHGTHIVLSQAQIDDVRILSEKVDNRSENEKVLRKAMSQAWNQGALDRDLPPAPARFEWRDFLRRPTVYPFAHDRFVVLDDGLWHFGFAACGSSNHLSAASGPWPVEETGAVSFYEKLWEELSYG
jgi:hypothetical protein